MAESANCTLGFSSTVGIAGKRVVATGRPDGSSPYVRGTLIRCVRAYGANRFIPACARNAREGTPSAKNGSVHPRMCGERGGTLYRCRGHGGSSPHARGTRQGLTREPGRHRFILACAGNACAGRPRLPQSAVHPRMCGECLPAASTASILIGPSPHARGTLVRMAGNLRQRRFIPACVGNASRISATCSATPVHPRMCGERELLVNLLHEFHGSSPHTRGTPLSRFDLGQFLRFIPACAGNAPWR